MRGKGILQAIFSPIVGFKNKKRISLRRCVAAVLLYSQLVQIAAAAVAPMAPVLPSSSSYYQTNKALANNTPVSAGPLTPLLNYAQSGVWNNLSLNNKQLGLNGPLDLGVTYSDLTGTYLNAQYLLPVGERLAFGALGEYGANQYRVNGTLGYSHSPLTQFKATVERFG